VEAAVDEVVAEACVGPLVVVSLAVGDPVNAVCAAA
jgi:hypothetical protein